MLHHSFLYACPLLIVGVAGCQERITRRFVEPVGDCEAESHPTEAIPDVLPEAALFVPDTDTPLSPIELSPSKDGSWSLLVPLDGRRPDCSSDDPAWAYVDPATEATVDGNVVPASATWWGRDGQLALRVVLRPEAGSALGDRLDQVLTPPGGVQVRIHDHGWMESPIWSVVDDTTEYARGLGSVTYEP